MLADLFDRDAAGTCEGRSVLELGAGAGLPSLICALNGASTVVISDYQNPHSEDSVLVRAIEVSTEEACGVWSRGDGDD